MSGVINVIPDGEERLAPEAIEAMEHFVTHVVEAIMLAPQPVRPNLLPSVMASLAMSCAGPTDAHAFLDGLMDMARKCLDGAIAQMGRH